MSGAEESICLIGWVWIVLGVTIGVTTLMWLNYRKMTACEAHRVTAAEQARIRKAADAARANRYDPPR